MGKKKTSKAWVNRHLQDPYVKKAQQQGYRARAAFKLAELLDVEKISLRNAVVVDLGSTPGSWSQVVRERIKAAGGGGRVVALDMLPMEPIEGVSFLQGDFRDDDVLAQLETVLDGQAVDLVISDMAPNLSGVGPADAARIQHVCELAADFARRHLKPDGTLIVKAFHGSGFSQIVQDLKQSFVRVVERKPQASRDESSETFLVARRLKTPKPESVGS